MPDNELPEQFLTAIPLNHKPGGKAQGYLTVEARPQILTAGPSDYKLPEQILQGLPPNHELPGEIQRPCPPDDELTSQLLTT